MRAGSTEVAERIIRALSALRLDVVIVIVAAAFVISDAAPGRGGSKSDTPHSASSEATQSQRAHKRLLIAMPCTHERAELLTIHDDTHRFAPWAEYQAEGEVR